MEKIILKPTIREFLHRTKEENVYFDVLSYLGFTTQERGLGALFIVSQIKYSDEDLSYLVSLILSLAKREYYSEISLQEQNPKEAFSRTLKKLNEVLDDFFQSKNFKLNVGLIAIVGENIFISRLGKFKINLARNNQFIDILNNIELFRKDLEKEKQFSSIISGRLQANDKLFAFFPTRSISSREKQLNDILVKENQENFGQKVAYLAANVNNFSCCGVHINIQQIKEIPFQSTPRYSIPITASSTDTPARQISHQVPHDATSRQAKSKLTEKTSAVSASDEEYSQRTDDSPPKTEKTEEDKEVKLAELSTMERPRIIPAELSITKRGNIFTALADRFSKFRLPNWVNNKIKFGVSAVLATILIAASLLLVFSGDNKQTKNTLSLASEKLKLAQSQLNQNNTKEARSLLQATLLSVFELSSKKAEGIKEEANRLLVNLDRVSEKQPVVFSNLAEQTKNGRTILITAAGADASVIDTESNLLLISAGTVTELGRSKASPKFLLSTGTSVVIFDGMGEAAILDLKSKKIASYSLKDPSPATDIALYENNLYVLSENNIYKYADIIAGSVKRTDWGSDSANGKLIALTADGNIFALNENGKLIKYFKGGKLAEYELQVVPSAGSRIFAAKDSAFVYLSDKINRKVYVFDKSSGELKTSYDLTSAGKIQDISVSADGTIWILSADNKIWQIK